MGGYGAVKLAMRFPDKFCAAVSHSGALHFGSTPFEEFDQDRITEVRIGLGDTAVGGLNDPRVLAANVPIEKRPSIRNDCGTEDFLIEHNRSFHAFLNDIGYPHEYEEFPGEHNWGYWDTHIQESLHFLKPHIGIETN